MHQHGALAGYSACVLTPEASANSLGELNVCLQMQLKPWKKEGGDHTLLDLMPFLEAIYRANVPDVRKVVQSYEGQNIPVAFR